MNQAWDKYQITETESSFSFKPFHHYRNKLFWYVVTIILSGGLTFYFLNLRDELLFGISAAILFVAVLTLLKRLLFYIPTRYTFDLSANRV